MNQVHHPSASQKPNAAAASIWLFILALIAAGFALILSGCSTTGAGGPAGATNEAARIERIAGVAEVAAYSGAGYWLLDHPQDRDKFAAAIAALGAVTGDPVEFRNALGGLPVKELKGDKGALIVGAAVLLYETEFAQLTHIDQRSAVAVVARHVRAGLARALEQTAPR